MKLYHYVHCPFCVRVRMTLNFLKLPYESIVLSYDDESTPNQLMGKKMLPIFEKNDYLSNESLNIISFLDSDNLLQTDQVIQNIGPLNLLLDKIGSDVHSLAMPYWMWTPEFDNKSREYFQEKKEVKRGSFKVLVQNQFKFITSLNMTLDSLESKLYPFFESEELTLNDILIASHLWGMYIVPEFQFSPKLQSYLQHIKRSCNFNYHEDFWEVP